MIKGKFILNLSGPHLRPSGFTLIEVLIVFTILSIILGALYGAFFLSHKAVEGMDESLLKLHECRMAMDKLRMEGDSIFYSPKNERSIFKMEDRDIFGKQASRWTFTAFSPLIPGLSIISYYVEEMDGKPTLFKKIGSVYQPGVDEKGVEMVEGLEEFVVEARDQDRWVKTWDVKENKKIPEELRITITILMKERRVSLYETVKVKIGKTL